RTGHELSGCSDVPTHNGRIVHTAAARAISCHAGPCVRGCTHIITGIASGGGSPVAASAAIQIDTCSPNFLIQEANQGPLHKKICKEPLVFEKGFVVPPKGPGLGIEFDPAVIKKRRVE
ncbi:MAG: hypothetical protein EXR57_06620, partial [Dehalococcoidia bacterium]|nr:hypothetical protein [Dehalococcoidia bacterium]